MKDADKEIKRLTRDKQRLEQRLAEIAASGDHVELTRLGAELTAVLDDLDRAEESWLELADEAERAAN